MDISAKMFFLCLPSYNTRQRKDLGHIKSLIDKNRLGHIKIMIDKDNKDKFKLCQKKGHIKAMILGVSRKRYLSYLCALEIDR